MRSSHLDKHDIRFSRQGDIFHRRVPYWMSLSQCYSIKSRITITGSRFGHERQVYDGSQLAREQDKMRGTALLKNI